MAPKKKNVVLTGAARGIGRVIARHLALLGHNVFLIDINEEELVYAATSHIPKILAECSPDKTAQHGLVGHKVCDLRDPAAIKETISAAAAFFPNGQIDVLVNNAGIARAQFTGKRSMEDASVSDEFAAYLATHITAPFLVSQACIPFMKTKDDARTHPTEAVLRPEAALASAGCISEEIRRGLSRPELQSRCIVNISSFRALQSEPNCEGYAASKAGLLGLTQAMAISGAQWGIRCNAVLPGFTFVDQECKEGDESEGKMFWTQGISQSRHRHHPVGRIGYGEDVAEAIVWLMGAGFVTGQEIVVDGGISKVKHESA